MNTATNSKATLENILAEVRVLKAKYDERAEVTGENFNVFSILHMERYEVKTHSAIIAELLNSHGSHSQGTLFLKLFLNQLLKELQEEQKAQEELKQLREKLEQIKENEYDKFKVGVEVSFEKKGQRSQIDILIESHGIKSDSGDSSDVCIVIENKIYAEDQPRQLGRYYEYALDTGKKRGIIYLTLLGNKPEERTLYGDEPSEFYESGSDKIPLCGRYCVEKGWCPYESGKIPFCRILPKDTVICLSYKKFIHDWLDACIKEVARIPQIRETLHQYQMTVKELTGQPINRRYAMALKDILLEDKNYNLIPDLEAAISEAKDAFQCDFWTKLEEQLNGKVKNLRYEVYDNDLGIDEGRKAVEAYISARPAGKAPGLTFSFPESENENYEIMFRVAYDNGGRNLYYGFVLYEKGKRTKIDIDDVKHREYLDLGRYSIDNGGKDYPNGWLAYKYFEKPEINFTNFTFVTEHKELNREDSIKKLVGGICKVVEKVSEQEQAQQLDP